MGKTNIMSVLTVAALALTLTSCSQDGPTAEDAATRLAEGLTTGDLSGVAFAAVSAEDAAAQLEEVTAGLDPASPTVSVAGVESTGEDTATAQLNHVWDLDDSDMDWTYTTTAELTLVDDEWQVGWDPSLAVDGLSAEASLAVSRTPAERAEVLGAESEVLVTERPVIRVGIDKTRIEASGLESSSAALAELVGLDPAAYTEQVLGAGEQAFVEAIVLRDNEDRPVSDEEIDAIAGASGIPDTMSLAPTRTFARELLGSVGPVTAELVAQSEGRLEPGDVAGLSGLQLQYDEQLGGTPGMVIEAVTGEGETRTSEVLFEKAPVPGEPLELTLDPALQTLAENVLAEEPSASSIVAIRPSTGEILTVANGPGSEGLQTALLGQYPPGSTFKVATSLALLKNGFTPETTTSCPEELVVEGRAFNNVPGYPAQFTGEIPLLQAVAQSCNTGFISQREVISQEALASAAADLGIGIDVSIGTPGFFGSVPTEADGTAHAASMIGQGEVLVSPLSLAIMAASVGAGERVAPTLLAGNTAPEEAPSSSASAEPSTEQTAEAEDTETGTQEAPAPSNLTADQAADLREMMGAVVTVGGAQLLADIPGEPVLAKTGTAEFGTEDPPRTHAWVVALQGDLAVAVFVEEGERGSISGGPLMEDFLRGAGQ
ncbi:penicillin-binding transpeptidase domain-containing protein [Arthrobacter tumbae]|uniref:penicillin-binding transpeptidase domain-containing protein n=1 Tax=Arthrobacter tumbae TaxID=163874 RepID=UPI00195C3C50|nr:penicillin-binding transpeptidase domain-containing protein [Arthrobacter tumbae]MBM7780676.1 cell division protein FtsI/penicillin-binding protein 2 [Arthrobacter tumbae]